ncbi:hypothetical protein NDU88_003831 [Pleurodeles waltl]|uniref:Uncharacterized protein n=1 Tax=Pleurodeles waltl TaxID=8319 RepID=A0AAV7LGK8_PLEWA|nr:hypothetical protein NDU88_003831 [Pleurodeles waltl]
MVGPRSHRKDASIRDLLTKAPRKKADRSEKDTLPEQSNALGDTTISPNEAEPVAHTFTEALFGAIRSDIVTLKQDLAKHIKGITKDVNERGIGWIPLSEPVMHRGKNWKATNVKYWSYRTKR